MLIKRYIHAILLVIAGNLCLPVYGQEDLLREFDAFVNRENRTFDNRVKQMNKEFADYLKKEWSSFPTYVNQPPSIDPDTSFTQKTETIQPEIKNQKEEAPLPSAKTENIRKGTGQLVVPFFGMSLSLPFDRSFIIALSNARETTVSNAWKKASDIEYTPLLKALLQYKKELRLNDWGYVQLVQQSTKAIYAGQNYPDGATFLATFLLNQSSYAVKLARINDRLALLVEIKETIYNVPQLKNGRQTLSIFYSRPLPPTAKVFTYKESLPFATGHISMQIPELPLLNGEHLSTVLPHQWQNHPIAVEVNKALIDFFSTMPQTELIVYGRSGTSEQIKALCRQLKKYIENKSETEAVSLLLDFVQHTFDYQSDTRQFGYEKVFFPDEMLYYSYNDCEDRAIFFCRLVQLLLNLPVALVDYPNHIAAAVCFSEATEGTRFRQGDKEYTLCDPTYINAGIGECMQKFAGIKAKLIIL
ncbi:hypothetical protein [Parabacteroides sp.]